MSPKTRGRLALLGAALAGCAWVLAGAARRPAPLHGVWEAYRAASARGDLEGALPRLRSLLADDPDNPLYLRESARAHYAAKDDARAAEAAERFLALGGEPGEVCPLLGNAYWRLGDRGRALEAHARCLRLEPASLALAFHLAQALEEVGRWDEAEPIYNALRERAPQLLGVRLSLARLRLRQGRTAEAAALAEEALRQDPQSTAALYLSASAARAVGDSARALERVGRLVRARPGEPSFRRLLAELRAEARRGGARPPGGRP